MTSHDKGCVSMVNIPIKSHGIVATFSLPPVFNVYQQAAFLTNFSQPLFQAKERCQPELTMKKERY